MDSKRFDAAVRAFGSGASRRHVLRLLAGGTLGMVGLGRSRAAEAHGDRVAICHLDRASGSITRVTVSQRDAWKHLSHRGDYLYQNCCTDGDCRTPANPCVVATCHEGACRKRPGNEGVPCGEPADACSPAPVCSGEAKTCPPAVSACAPDERCEAGVCVRPCSPACGERVCGDDGCGGSCGACGDGETCASGLCVCAPDCGERVCGEDGCGGMCGECGSGERCEAGVCVPLCRPECGDSMCGDDGCGGTCGTCAPDERCETGTCTPICAPDCSGRSCGDDGCGGTCGACTDAERCEGGACVPRCTPDCAGHTCGDDGCGGSCGSCAAGEWCDAGVCAPVCTPDCTGKSCGSDGCGGTCGACAPGDLCCAGGCVDPNRNDHCGACGHICPPDQTCELGACVPWVPGICTAGSDSGTSAPWVVCRADATSAWIAGAARGSFHAEQICRDLGYARVDAYGGTCGQVCGSCQATPPSCQQPGPETFNGRGNCGADANGLILCFAVHWRCAM